MGIFTTVRNVVPSVRDKFVDNRKSCPRRWGQDFFIGYNLVPGGGDKIPSIKEKAALRGMRIPKVLSFIKIQ